MSYIKRMWKLILLSALLASPSFAYSDDTSASAPADSGASDSGSPEATYPYLPAPNNHPGMNDDHCGRRNLDVQNAYDATQTGNSDQIGPKCRAAIADAHDACIRQTSSINQVRGAINDQLESGVSINQGASILDNAQVKAIDEIKTRGNDCGQGRQKVIETCQDEIKEFEQEQQDEEANGQGGSYTQDEYGSYTPSQGEERKNATQKALDQAEQALQAAAQCDANSARNEELANQSTKQIMAKTSDDPNSQATQGPQGNQLIMANLEQQDVTANPPKEDTNFSLTSATKTAISNVGEPIATALTPVLGVAGSSMNAAYNATQGNWGSAGVDTLSGLKDAGYLSVDALGGTALTVIGAVLPCFYPTTAAAAGIDQPMPSQASLRAIASISPPH